MPDLLSPIRKTQVWKSIFRHGPPNTTRNRTLVVLTNFFLHLHPVKVRNRAFASRSPGAWEG